MADKNSNAGFNFFTPSKDSGEQRGGPPPSPGATGDFRADGFESNLRPARNVQDIQGQVGQLIVAFQGEHDREPTPEDAEFWIAYKKLVEGYKESAEHTGTDSNYT